MFYRHEIIDHIELIDIIQIYPDPCESTRYFVHFRMNELLETVLYNVYFILHITQDL